MNRDNIFGTYIPSRSGVHLPLYCNLRRNPYSGDQYTLYYYKNDDDKKYDIKSYPTFMYMNMTEQQYTNLTNRVVSSEVTVTDSYGNTGTILTATPPIGGFKRRKTHKRKHSRRSSLNKLRK